MAFVDGHADFLTPEISTSKGVAGMRSAQAVGMEVTIFDPEFDPDGSLAGRLADMLVDSFGPPWVPC